MLSNQLIQGLSTSEVIARRTAGKGAVMPPHTGRSYVQIIRENVFAFVYNILYALCLALLLLGQVSEALVSVGTVLFNVVVSLVQEVRAKRTLDRVALLTRPKASVIRDGQEQSIDPGELVQDDILMIHPGDRVMVDGPLIGDGRIEVDESLLSGESDLITKQAGDMLYSGSFCVTGSACYRAEKLGIESIAGQLTARARAFRRVYTPLQREINLIIQSLLLVAFYIETILVLVALATRDSVVDTVRMSVVVIGIVPVGLLLASAVAYALGALRIVGKSALVQRLSAIESLSNVDVLCLDKTGTLTANALVLEKMHPYGITEPALRRLLGLYVANTSSSNATSRAIGEQGHEHTLQVREEIPFSSARKWSALSIDDVELQGVYVLGAPELLHPFLRLDVDLGTFADEEMAQGMRVVLFAFFQDIVPLRPAAGEPTRRTSS